MFNIIFLLLTFMGIIIRIKNFNFKEFNKGEDKFNIGGIK